MEFMAYFVECAIFVRMCHVLSGVRAAAGLGNHMVDLQQLGQVVMAATVAVAALFAVQHLLVRGVVGQFAQIGAAWYVLPPDDLAEDAVLLAQPIIDELQCLIRQVNPHPFPSVLLGGD